MTFVIPGFSSILFVSFIVSSCLLLVRRIVFYVYLLFRKLRNLAFQSEKAEYHLYLFEWTFYLFSISGLQLVYRYFESPSKVFFVAFVILGCSIVPSFNFIIRPLFLFMQKNVIRAAPDLQNWVEKNLAPSIKVYVQNQNHTNAFAEGVVPISKTIIIGNNLVRGLTREELRAVLYHEMGHLELRHIPIYYLTNIIASSLFGFAVFLVYRLPMESGIYHAFIFALIGGICGGLFYALLPGFLLKRLEYEADEFAVKRVGFDTYKRTLERIDTLSDGLLGKGDTFHPTLAKRIKNVLKYRSVAN